ncbi:MAG TPA: aminotransferase class I/II-fold pyridoxal phosphate-dependent enzyme, partial [Acidimicrobiia bacterium]
MANFAVGNPQDMAMPDYVSSLRRHLEPKDPHWFGYKFSEPEARRTVAEGLSHATGMAWEPNDVAMTNGGFGALAVALRSVVDPGDEVIYLSPPWFFYELLTLAAGGEPVPVPLRPPRFDVDLGLVESAITDRTRAIIFNNPQNPSGRVYPRESIISMSEMLIGASERVGHPLWVISDEPYKKILFDGSEFHSPAEHYPHTLVAYSYGKTLLAPGQRIGYLTVPPSLPEAQRATLRQEIFVQQTATGYAFPNALLQHALPELEQLSIDVGV